MDNFNQTVNLREKMEKPRPASAIEKIYQSPEADLKTLNRPGQKNDHSARWRALVLALIIVMAGAAVYVLFFKNQAAYNRTENWYAVRLINNEVYYGQIMDLKTDPIALSKVYYNYDQARKPDQEISETGSLKLVKRGQETHGPDGTMEIVRGQVLFMEPMSGGSKVLKAILEYEK